MTYKMLKEVFVDTALGLTITYELFEGLKKMLDVSRG
jgi:hypothetical protein